MSMTRVSRLTFTTTLVLGFLSTGCGTSVRISGVAITSAKLSAITPQPENEDEAESEAATPTPTPGPVGPITCSVYDLSSLFAGQSSPPMPDFSTLVSLATFHINVIDVAPIPSTQVFPWIPTALAGYSSNFGISCTGKLKVETAGGYILATHSSDGSRLKIDDTIVVNHFFKHDPLYVYGEAYLSEGEHPFQLDYYHADGAQYALQLLWSRGESGLSVIPESSYAAP